MFSRQVILHNNDANFRNLTTSVNSVEIEIQVNNALLIFIIRFKQPPIVIRNLCKVTLKITLQALGTCFRNQILIWLALKA